MRGKIRFKLKQFHQGSTIQIQLLSTCFADGKDMFILILDIVEDAINNYDCVVTYLDEEDLNFPELNENDECGIAVCLMFETESEVYEFIRYCVNSRF